MVSFFKPPVLLAVAHWDDEVLSAGGTIIKYCDNWTMVSATYRLKNTEYDYESVFKNVCKIVRANPITLSICHRTQEENISRSTPKTELNTEVLDRALTDVLGNYKDKFNTIITHNPKKSDPNHHVQHLQLSKSLTELFSDKDIYYFVGWPCGSKKNIDSVIEYNEKHSTHSVKLNNKELNRKIELIKMYKPNYPWFSDEMKILDKEWYAKRSI